MPRPPKKRTVDTLPDRRFFKPAGVPLSDLDTVKLKVEELEALRLKHCENLDQKDGAERMEISRATFQRVLKSACTKVSEALVDGKAIDIHGGEFRLRGRPRCKKCDHTWAAAKKHETCPECSSAEISYGVRRRRRRGPKTD